MLLVDFINAKNKELKEEHREVEFDKAINVELSKNTVSEQFLEIQTNMTKEIEEADLSTLTSKHSGYKVIFKVKPPRKRKFRNLEFYVLWK